MANKRRGTLTKREAVRLAQLLKKMGQDPSGYIPDEAWLAVQETFAMPYLELCIVRRHEGRVEILLQHRGDDHFIGWNIPGGLWRTKHSLEQGVGSVAAGENLGSEVKLTVLSHGPWDKWDDHPYGHPISMLVICSASGVQMTEDLLWFSGVPKEMVHPRQAKFVTMALKLAQQCI